ncbi:iron complex transport system permease protein [Symbiobacterium terraclitae]|uniref:Iron complex transport system permease protein n=1 Tax=Symbiobacterium terraclitae TaxID=557451 RepID=A0ABS4JWC7_9FIRM|nr:iron complex transport system permease protein [Symbiobacterium terraclitae]
MKRSLVIPVLAVLLVLLTAVSLFVGVSDIRPADLFRLSEDQWTVLVTSRFPRTAAIALAGIGMGVSGLIMQQLSRNKFVSPTTAGTDDSARLGILVAMILFGSASMMQKMMLALVFALAGTHLFMLILDRVKLKDAIFIPLVGLMFGNIVSSITTFYAYRYDLLQAVTTWLQGNFALVIKGRYELLYLAVPAVIAAYVYANRFTIAGMGEDFATNLGLNYRRVVNVGLSLVALISSLVILTVGLLPFLGLIIPNLVSLFQGDHLRRNLPLTALVGAVFLLACDIVGRVIIYPYEVPIGLTVGVIGSGMFLYLLWKGQRTSEA